MKEAWKQVLGAFLMGVVVPAAVLTLAVAVGGQARPPAWETVGSPSGEAVPSPSGETETAPSARKMVLPVLLPDGSVEDMELADYLTGVLLAEMPAEFEPEALKAQAVVSGTYALRKQAKGSKHGIAAVCTDAACCQAYRDPETYLASGGTAENLDKVKEAVAAVSGQVLTYGGELIEATFFSCSGGSTEDAVAVWGSDVPYLQATPSPGEEMAEHYTDTATFSRQQLEAALDVTLTGSSDTWFSGVCTTEGGGVASAEVAGITFTGVELRQLLGLRSTDMTFQPEEDGVTIVTHGYGHRVGMSQYGAQAMALSGSTYGEILAHYYQGTALETWAGR